MLSDSKVLRRILDLPFDIVQPLSSTEKSLSSSFVLAAASARNSTCVITVPTTASCFNVHLAVRTSRFRLAVERKLTELACVHISLLSAPTCDSSHATGFCSPKQTHHHHCIPHRQHRHEHQSKNPPNPFLKFRIWFPLTLQSKHFPRSWRHEVFSELVFHRNSPFSQPMRPVLHHVSPWAFSTLSTVRFFFVIVTPFAVSPHLLHPFLPILTHPTIDPEIT